MNEEGHGDAILVRYASQHSGILDPVRRGTEASSNQLPVLGEVSTRCELEHIPAIDDDLARLLVDRVFVAIATDDEETRSCCRDQQRDEVDVLMPERAHGAVRSTVTHDRVVDVTQKARTSHGHVTKPRAVVSQEEVQVTQQVQSHLLQQSEEFQHDGTELGNQ